MRSSGEKEKKNCCGGGKLGGPGFAVQAEEIADASFCRGKHCEQSTTALVFESFFHF